jgi:hypothetical protein
MALKCCLIVTFGKRWKWHEAVLFPLGAVEQKEFRVSVYTDDEAWNAVLINEVAHKRIVPFVGGNDVENNTE